MATSLADLQTVQSAETFRTIILDLLASVSFPVEAWQEEGVARAFVEAAAALGVSVSGLIAQLAKMGFLTTAEGDYLTALVKSHYDEDRNAATRSTFDVDMVNSGLTTHTITAAGQVTLRASNGATFKNTGATVIASQDTTAVTFTAEFAGSEGNIPAQVLELVTPLAGVIASFDGTITSAANDAESDPKLRERARSKWGTLRVEKVREGVLNLARSAAASIHSVTVDDDNPRGAGTVDVYLAAINATAGGADVTAVQAALDAAFFGNGSVDQLVKAFAAPTQAQNLVAKVYIQGVTVTDAQVALTAAWRDFLETVPIGGFDLSPGPVNVILAAQITDALSQVDGVLGVELTTPSTFSTSVPANTKVVEGTISFTIVSVTSLV